MKKKLQVFISSTYLDLQNERQQAVQAILNAGHIPAGMELFKAGSETQLTVIKKWIDESDVYMLILGGRYGSVDIHNGKSYTQLEYEYAVNSKKPLFAIVLNDLYLKEKSINNSNIEIFETIYKKQYYSFKELVESKMVKFIEELKDIDIVVLSSLSKLEYNENLIGWVKPELDFTNSTEEVPMKIIKHTCYKCGKEEILPSCADYSLGDCSDEVFIAINRWHAVNAGEPGYGSKLDSSILNFELCDNCLLKIIEQFKLKDLLLE